MDEIRLEDASAAGGIILSRIVAKSLGIEWPCGIGDDMYGGLSNKPRKTRPRRIDGSIPQNPTIIRLRCRVSWTK
jgi:hypothetical protein